MSKALPSEGKSFPRSGGRGSGALDRLAAFRFTYAALFVFLVLYVFTVKGVERVLDAHFGAAVARALQGEGDGELFERLGERMDRTVHASPWVRIGGVRVTAIVIGADGTPLYVGRGLPRPPSIDALQAALRMERLLPATADVTVSVPHNSLLANGILVTYAALLVATLFVYNRRLARREEERLAAAIASREQAAARAGRIEDELEEVRRRLASRQATSSGAGEAIRALRQERARLQEQLAEVTRREQELASRAGKAQSLDEERHALEELLEEATRDLSAKDEEIRSLEQRLRRAAKAPAPTSGRELEQVERRLRTLYKNLEIDERAVRDLVGLRDEAMKLKAEEALKRLSDDAESAAVRRKVGGLPPHLSVFELGFAGKGRIYTTRGRQRRFRVLAIGAKNTQKVDLEYLSRLPRED